jgi:hypothetical protein
MADLPAVSKMVMELDIVRPFSAFMACRWNHVQARAFRLLKIRRTRDWYSPVIPPLHISPEEVALRND